MHPSKMNQFKRCILGLLGAMGMASTPSHAYYVVQSLTIEEIGVASGGLGTSANFALGGEFNWVDTNHGPYGFVCTGSTDGKILMGRRQEAKTNTPEKNIFDSPTPVFFPNTLD